MISRSPSLRVMASSPDNSNSLGIRTAGFATILEELDVSFCGHHAPSIELIIEAAMATQQFMLSEFPWDKRYSVTGVEDVLTPALAVYPEIIAANIARTLHLLGGGLG